MAYGISDLKVLIENMTNGVGSAYLGVRALDIDKEKRLRVCQAVSMSQKSGQIHRPII